MQDDAPRARPASCTQLFLAFSALALQGFGGVLAVAQRVLCEERRWLTQAEFVELLSLGQVLPGPNVCNLSLMVGDRYFGTRGAFAALAGMLAAPLALALAAMALYVRFAELPVVAGALRGMGAVAAGLVLGTAIKLAAPLRDSPLGRPLAAALGGACFAAVAWARLPLVVVLLGLGSLACLLAWWRLPEDAS
ncbi:MAG TPA: chromate transporter [Methylibium sp.]|nr:chromate transporter [Methylibium sp.]